MYYLTLWKLILSSKGTAIPSLVLLLSHVMVFLQTGKRMRAMLNLSVSAAPLAAVTQYPMTSNTARFLYWMNFQVNSPAQMASHSSTTQILFQLSSMKYSIPLKHLLMGFGSLVGTSFWLSSWLKILLFVVRFVDGFGACRSSSSKLCNCIYQT